jgi:SAM-dependent methyltransferase
MAIFRTMKNAVFQLRSRGVLRTTRYATERISESYHEWRLGVRTSGKVSCADLGIENPLSVHYYPSDYRTIYKAFRHLRVRAGRDVFLDFGCGMGRVLVVAGTRPFRKVIGIDLSAEMCELARANVARARKKLKCPEVEVIAGDATTYHVPDEVSVIFFYSPFQGALLTTVLENIRASLLRAPRELTMVFKNTTDLENHLGPEFWLVKQHEFPACDAAHTVMILRNRL